jgi:hypothetical protein
MDVLTHVPTTTRPGRAARSLYTPQLLRQRASQGQRPLESRVSVTVCTISYAHALPGASGAFDTGHCDSALRAARLPMRSRALLSAVPAGSSTVRRTTTDWHFCGPSDHHSSLRLSLSSISAPLVSPLASRSSTVISHDSDDCCPPLAQARSSPPTLISMRTSPRNPLPLPRLHLPNVLISLSARPPPPRRFATLRGLT